MIMINAHSLVLIIYSINFSMKNKVSKTQIGMLLYLICCSLYLGISDIVLLELGKNEVLISMIVGTALGLIPVLMYLKINNTYPELNLYEKNTKLFGNRLGNIINILIILFYIVFLTISIRSIVILATSKYLQSTPYVLIGILAVLTSLTISTKGLETLSRISQILFFISTIFMIFIELFLIKYIEVDNILPMFIEKNYLSNIFKASIYHASSCGLLAITLLSVSKNEINNNKNYSRTIISYYLLSSLSLILVMFFVVSCFGYDMANLFRYPEYILLKKIGLLDSELHLENLLAFRWTIYMISLANISLYSILCGIKKFSRNIKLNKLLAIIICIFSIYMGKILLGNISHSTIIIKNYYMLVFVMPIFILLLVIFIKCIFIKNKQK